MQYIGSAWVEKEIELGHKVYGEGSQLLILLLLGFGLYSIVFIIWATNIIMYPQTKRIFELIFIFFFGVIPAIMVAIFFFYAFKPYF